MFHVTSAGFEDVETSYDLSVPVVMTNNILHLPKEGNPPSPKSPLMWEQPGTLFRAVMANFMHQLGNSMSSVHQIISSRQCPHQLQNCKIITPLMVKTLFSAANLISSLASLSLKHLRILTH